ncbi:MAG: sigma-70 family RNA polymerase sigma factor [Bacteroidota bacterium]
MSIHSDQQIIKGLQSNDHQETNQTLRVLYGSHYELIDHFIRRNGGTEDDAADVFQDAVIVFYRKVRLGELQLNCSIQTYLFSICKNIWLYRLRSRKKQVQWDVDLEAVLIEEDGMDILLREEHRELIAGLIGQLGERCQQILKLYYFDRMRMREIALRMGFKSEQAAKNKKAACMKKLRAMIEASAQLKKIFSK